MSIEKIIKQSLTKQIDETTIPDELDQRVRQSFHRYHEKKEPVTMKKKLVMMGLVAAIILPTGVYAALNGTSYFADNPKDLNNLVGEEVKRAAAKGLSIPIDQKITDQGITIHFTEVYAEDSKVLLHYRIEQQNGELVPFEFDTTGLDVVGEANGNPVYQEKGLEGTSVLNFFGTKEDNMPFYLTDESGKEVEVGIADHNKPEGVLAFSTLESKLPQPLTLNIDVNRIGKTKGNWKGQFIVDQSKAKEATEAAK
ncbi:DUF4179 domain-containing protein [Brevibacillus sp. Leaf182]|uniref:DUF4179 domain-containing protein n=1 Tax=Brevibacillus sp. Leaf182 TaxID=1736290 RepID=UPI000700C80E|nr:DUF4179 domain-containing protein [Brevibacillus sp. Leaf182]RAT97223.1 DUF4179 domain-containing protein [Brevibacillus sp. Leaf182]